ncbi:L-threonylcarbamoyladenylate synthase [Actinotalea sp. AC32]|nr:L-threonylcarbamoyladenylate synthase [Actinotalea sp. AC32]
MIDCRDPGSWGAALDEAVHALGRGALVVLPTGTAYGVAADAFSPTAVDALAAAKGRGRVVPPVLVPDARTVDGLCTDVPDEVRALLAQEWPGPLTLVLRAQPSLAWDLAPDGTVAVRAPDHPAALALLRRTGPLAVTGAHRAGGTQATTVEQAREALGDAVHVYLDAGPLDGGARSTVLDATVNPARVLRPGAVPVDRLAAVLPAGTGEGDA